MPQTAQIEEFKRRGITVYLTKDDLPEYLQAYVSDGVETGGIRFFHHPLLVQMMPMGLPATIEEVLAVREAVTSKELAEGKIAQHLFRHERPYRMDRLLELVELGEFDAAEQGRLRTAAEFWQLAASVWTDSETDESDPIWSILMGADVPHRQFMSGTTGRRFINSLPAVTTVYRGVPAPSESVAGDRVTEGWSWTSDRRVAQKFAKRFCRSPNRPYIATARINRDDIAVCLLGRNESELLIEPGSVSDFVLSHTRRA